MIKDSFCSVIYQNNCQDFFSLLSSNAYFHCESVYKYAFFFISLLPFGGAFCMFFHVEFKAVHGTCIERERFSTSLPIPYWGPAGEKKMFELVWHHISKKKKMNSVSFDMTDWIIHQWEWRTFLQLGDPLQQWVEGVLGALAVSGCLVVQLALFLLKFGHSGQQLALQVTQTPLQQVSQLAGKRSTWCVGTQLLLHDKGKIFICLNLPVAHSVVAKYHSKMKLLGICEMLN